MGILTWIKLAGVVVLIGVCGYYVVNYKLMESKVATQKIVIEQQQQAIEYYQKAAQIDVDTAKQKEQLHEVINSNDPQRILDYFKRMRDLSTRPESDD